MSLLRYSSWVERCTVLGPGKRAVLWVHGCCFSCEGCIGENYKSGGWLETTPEDAARWYLESGSEGLTVSGGEPMLQAEALAEMVERIRQERDCGVIVYTGFLYEELLERGKQELGLSRFLSQIDLLIDGPYRRELDWNQPYRGSENQRLLPLTDRYRSSLESYYGAAEGRAVELRLSGSQTLLVGVPGKEQAEVWRKIKRLGEQNEGRVEA